MPRFYFDINDGRRETHDAVGLRCDSRDALLGAAVSVLPEVASEELPDNMRRVFTVKVRNAAGRYVLYASLSLAADWLDESAEATGFAPPET
ncbi:hypothetical protein N1F89_06525 [Aquibium sp. A9E412]|uniref:DUF6894 family protein n=1 Tax=Aquibium sp. A9E412 TaxID=2976767 RepID=UPI0025B125F2|nr:hypothetical protein [Aquibium sp. A9E412]MDN2565870.1 hypothetical protein [Aquibium sp. A9E412]